MLLRTSRKKSHKTSSLILFTFMFIVLLSVVSCSQIKKDSTAKRQDNTFEVTPKETRTYIKLLKQNKVVIEYANVTREQSDYDATQSPVTVSFIFGTYRSIGDGRFKINRLSEGIEYFFKDKRAYAARHAYKIRRVPTARIQRIPERRLTVRLKNNRMIIQEPNLGYFYLKPIKRQIPETLTTAEKKYIVSSKYSPTKYVNDGADD